MGLQPYDLKCENLPNPTSIDTPRPHFSWKLTSPRKDDCQTAYEIQVGRDSLKLTKGKADLWNTGKVIGKEQIMLPWKGVELTAGDYCYWRVRVYDRDGNASKWSSVNHFSVGLDDTTFTPTARYLMQPATLGNQEAPIFRKTIFLKKVEKTLIHVNSLGYHEVWVNGCRISDIVLAPAVTQLNKRSAIVAYDITPALRKGENTIEMHLGQGWYKKDIFDARYPGPVVRAEIDVIEQGRSRTIAVTDSTWTVRRSGYSGIGSWWPLHFGGERYEQPDGRTAQADEVELPGMKATTQMFEGNRIIAREHPQTARMTADGWVADLGRNIAGWYSMTFHGLKKGQEVKMEYCDDLKDGEFQSLEGMGEYDVYVASGDGEETFCNRFHSHAYRYVRVSGLGYEPQTDDALCMEITGTNDSKTTFECSDLDINAIHDMIQHTVRCLTFSGYMVDCPHLERMGYGGDGNSSTMTLQTMFDAAPTYYNWLQAWADAQDEDGGMPHVAPAGGGGGGPYWCGFIVQAPYRAYLNYADDRMLTKHYDNMQRWLEYVKKYTRDGLLGRWPDTKNRMWFLGDWLTPMGVDAGNEKSVMLVSNCFVSECLQSMTRMAEHLGRTEDAMAYAEWRNELNRTIHERFFNAEDCTYATGSPLDMAYALNVGVVPQELYNKVNERLVELSRTKYNTHIAVGLVGVPIFTEWATRNREAALMYDILKQEDYPGYLNMIRNGATTTWESWDRSRSRIHNCYNGIGTWFYQALGGIVPDPDYPGYEHFTVSPQLVDGIDWVKVTKECPYGTITVEWTRNGDDVDVVVECPIGTSY